MASLFDSDSECEDFEGFTQVDLGENGSVFTSQSGEESESDVSVESSLSDESDSEDQTHVNNAENWSRDPTPLNVQPFTAIYGPVTNIPAEGNADDVFSLLFGQELFELIVREINRYAEQCIASKPDPKWQETTVQEMKAFFGLHVIFGIHQLPSTRLYWSKDPFLGVESVQKVMLRNRFDKIKQYLHLSDKTNAVPRGMDGHDKLYKTRPVLDHVLQRCQQEYNPGKNISVDEAMVKFKGRLGIKQYMPMKPVKRGIKIWEAADPRNGYVFNFQVYTGKQDGGIEHGLGISRCPRSRNRPGPRGCGGR